MLGELMTQPATSSWPILFCSALSESASVVARRTTLVKAIRSSPSAGSESPAAELRDHGAVGRWLGCRHDRASPGQHPSCDRDRRRVSRVSLFCVYVPGADKLRTVRAARQAWRRT